MPIFKKKHKPILVLTSFNWTFESAAVKRLISFVVSSHELVSRSLVCNALSGLFSGFHHVVFTSAGTIQGSFACIEKAAVFQTLWAFKVKGSIFRCLHNQILLPDDSPMPYTDRYTGSKESVLHVRKRWDRESLLSSVFTKCLFFSNSLYSRQQLAM